MLSLVVPAISVTIYLSSPIRELIKDDFPALGLPTTANLGSSSSTILLLFGNFFTNSSNSSPVPLPFIAETE